MTARNLKTRVSPTVIRNINLRAGVDLPFLPPPDPIVTVLDLPMPPSVNAIWRNNGRGGVYKSKGYTDWQTEAGHALLVDNKLRTRKTITGPFSAVIEIRKRKGGAAGDVDNRIKAVLDFCQLHRFVTDDMNMQWVLAKFISYRVWSYPRACRVTLREEVE